MGVGEWLALGFSVAISLVAVILTSLAWESE